MALELVRTNAGTMLMGASDSKANEIISAFEKNHARLSRAVKSSPINLSEKSKKGAIAALVERAPHGKNELATPTKARIFNSGKAISRAIAAGPADPKARKVVAGAAATWMNLATNYKSLLSQNPILLFTAAKALVQEAKLALKAAGAT